MYTATAESELSKLVPPSNAFLCDDVNCKNESHIDDLNNFHNAIVNALNLSSSSMFKHEKKLKSRPGWNEYVEEYHTAARDAFKLWVQAGKPREGPVFELKKRSNLRYKYAVRFIKRHVNELKKETLAKKLCVKDQRGFWKEIKA